MRRKRLFGSFLFSMLLLAVVSTAIAANIPAKRRPAHKTSVAYDVPLLLFQSIDRRLTLLDEDNQKLQLATSDLHGAHAQMHTQAKLRSRRVSRKARLRTVDQLVAISSRAERNYRRHRQAYGARLFRDLHAKLVPLKKQVVRASSDLAITESGRDERLINMSLLSVIHQFQAISGGYAALACRPGTWACCQPKVIREGGSRVHGCSWSCASTLKACRGGCLGPRTPETVVAVKNTPRPPTFAPARSARLAANTKTRKAEHPSIRAGERSAGGSN